MENIVKSELLREIVNQVSALRIEVAEIKEIQVQIKKMLSSKGLKVQKEEKEEKNV